MKDKYVLFKDTPIMMELTMEEITKIYGIKQFKHIEYPENKIIDTIEEFDVVNKNEDLLFRGTIKDIAAKLVYMNHSESKYSVAYIRYSIIQNIKKNNYMFYKTDRVYYKDKLYSVREFMNKFNLTQLFFKIRGSFAEITDEDLEKFNKTRPRKKILVRGKLVEYINFTDLVNKITNGYRKYKTINMYTKKYNSFLKKTGDEQKTVDMFTEWCDNLKDYNYFIVKEGNKIKYNTIVELSLKLGKDLNTVKSRIQKGYTLEECFYVKKQVHIMNKYNGKYMHLKDICRMENKNFIDVYNFMRDVYTLDYALEHTTREFIENDE